jgi:hypothetical protein
MNTLNEVMARLPDLTIDGLDGMRRHDFAVRRAELTSPAAQKAFELAREWFERVPTRKSVNRDFSSYMVKHGIQQWAGDYIGNGIAIAAAASCGVAFARAPSGINAFIAVAGPKNWPRGRRVTV